jgi:hypothetical protein
MSSTAILLFVLFLLGFFSAHGLNKYSFYYCGASSEIHTGLFVFITLMSLATVGSVRRARLEAGRD